MLVMELQNCNTCTENKKKQTKEIHISQITLPQYVISAWDKPPKPPIKGEKAWQNN